MLYSVLALISFVNLIKRRFLLREPLPVYPLLFRAHYFSYFIFFLNSLSWKIFPHPPCSPDISSFDYHHLFLLLNNHLQDWQFGTREELKKELNNFFACKDRDFFCNGIYKLVSCWEKIVDCDGNYFNK